MDRRQYVVGFGTATGTLLAGCLGGSERGPTIMGSAATLTQNGTTSITVQAERVKRLSFGVSFLDTDGLSIESFAVEPEPDATAESYPPIWIWNEPEASVEATMVLRATADAPTGTVSYSVTAAGNEETVTESYEISVESSS